MKAFDKPLLLNLLTLWAALCLAAPDAAAREYPIDSGVRLGPGDWYDADRRAFAELVIFGDADSDRFRDACKYNYDNNYWREYQTIAQRADFYKWLDEYQREVKGHELRWPGAAHKNALYFAYFVEFALRIEAGTDRWLECISDRDAEVYAVSFKAMNRDIFNNITPMVKEIIERETSYSEQETFDHDLRILIAEQQKIQFYYTANFSIQQIEFLSRIASDMQMEHNPNTACNSSIIRDGLLYYFNNNLFGIYGYVLGIYGNVESLNTFYPGFNIANKCDRVVNGMFHSLYPKYGEMDESDPKNYPVLSSVYNYIIGFEGMGDCEVSYTPEFCGSPINRRPADSRVSLFPDFSMLPFAYTHTHRNWWNKCPCPEPKLGIEPNALYSPAFSPFFLLELLGKDYVFYEDHRGWKWSFGASLVDNLGSYHGGRELGYRTYRGLSDQNIGAQCTYDKQGRLIDAGPYLGTFDYGFYVVAEAGRFSGSPDFLYFKGLHDTYDVDPHKANPHYEPNLTCVYNEHCQLCAPCADNNCNDEEINIEVTSKKQGLSDQGSMELTVVVKDENGDCIDGLTNKNFLVCHDEHPGRGVYDVEALEGNKVDIVFIIDNSGTMKDEIVSVKTNIARFATNLANSGIDYALGACRMGGDIEIIAEESGGLFLGYEEFLAAIDFIDAEDVRLECGYDAIIRSVNGFEWRNNSRKIIIVITDESPNQLHDPSDFYTNCFIEDNGAAALATALKNDIVVYALLPEDGEGVVTWDNGTRYYFDRSEFSFVRNTGGKIFNIREPFNQILDDISNEAACAYRLRYRIGEECSPESKIKLTVQHDCKCNALEVDLGEPLPCCPAVALTAATRDMTTLGLPEDAFAPDETLPVSVIVTDPDPSEQPDATMLFYKAPEDETYRQAEMTRTKHDDAKTVMYYEGEIPSEYLQPPGVDFYVSCAEGVCLSTTSSYDPYSDPHRITIGDNRPPVVEANPVCVSLDSILTIQARVTDQTGYITRVYFYYRSPLRLQYEKMEMKPLAGGLYEANLHMREILANGIDYYFVAFDDAGAPGKFGDAANPLYLSLLDVSTDIVESVTSDGVALTTGEQGEYQWYREGKLIPGATYATLYASLPGRYTALISGPQGCKIAAYELFYEFSEIKVYPNPVTNGRFTIDAFLVNDLPVRIKVFSVNGQTVFDHTYDASRGAFRREVDISAASTGMYFLTIETGLEKSHHKLVKTDLLPE